MTNNFLSFSNGPDYSSKSLFSCSNGLNYSSTNDIMNAFSITSSIRKPNNTTFYC